MSAFWATTNFETVWGGIVEDLECEYFLIVLKDNLLKQVVTKPTGGVNNLYLVLINNDNMSSEVDVGSQLCYSGHKGD